jgi:AcrR family transcriptional regulator
MESSMAPPIRTPRKRWVDEGLRALAAGGPDAVRIESLAHALGVSKGGFYWHFESRSTLLDDLLDTWERVMVDDVVARAEAGGGDARRKLRRLFAEAARAGDLLKVDLAIRDWARRDEKVAERLKRVDNRRMDYMRSLFGEFCPDDDEVEVRSMLAFSVFIGNHFVAADHGGRSRGDVLRLITKRLEA